ncbi:hydroxymethylglutaryl-CoA reductase, degradative [Periweissella ghanensis]|uniref:3-hydroxy-3-methylglutaryl coenzyme A reductase n=1 Tax=Periweissella ghanensis TaxID=467997 RepID=A0ABM8ZDV1_9LACO|nr:hydroxymethylglutaryl-CoA reductase, degradative [Periweissella ghanensis]MCM0600203.1 hydroxymethylglutaryl-CoA reductase, degradative [Periweissella ghanensis]CAH0419092.1 3-hydroxy-3-methylglutaryl-coenzyme A reductase [Periweissella ghanensis]
MKFHQMNWQQRLAAIDANTNLSTSEKALLNHNYSAINEQMIENYITSFSLPEGVLPNIIINDDAYQVPMVTEEPSVIAAASNGARMINMGGGVHTTNVSREMIGQVLINDADFSTIETLVTNQAAHLIDLGNAAHPSMAQRGGGLKRITTRDLGSGFVSVDLHIDTQAAMGANVVNTISEAVAGYFKAQQVGNVVMAILSNFATSSLVTAKVALPFKAIAKAGFEAADIAQRIVLANQFSQRDPYRATTENKGVMNGIDAVVMASGNDWRAISAGVHAYAARDGQYRNLVTWTCDDTTLYGEITVPMPVGIVGGSISIVPLVQTNHKLLNVDSASQLAQVIVAVGLAQNLSALRALVTSGIQAGHMQLQLKSLALAVGATIAEVPVLVTQLQQAAHADMQTARQLLTEMREK